jgi:tetratricopeptide (TPR) repeat protein
MIHSVLALWLAVQGASPEAAQHLQAGIDADKQQHFEVAISEFRKVTELDPKLVAGFVNLGEVYMETHDYASAIAPLRHALQLDPDLPAAHQLLGYALLAQGYAAEAIPHLERVKEQAALGIAQLETGQLPEAVANLRAALKVRPNDPDLLYYLGRASGLLSKQTIDTLLATYPDSARGHQAMGENYFVLRRMPEAEKEYVQALHQRPDTPGIHLELGLVYAGASQWTQAEKEFRAETKLQPGNAEAAFRLGDALLRQGNAHAARAELERSNRLQPGMPETLYSLGKAASLDNDPASAQKAWSDLLSIEKEGPLAAQAHFGLAALYRKQGDAAQAEREMKEFQRLQEARSPSSEDQAQQPQE